jgi:hypothetical protein
MAENEKEQVIKIDLSDLTKLWEAQTKTLVEQLRTKEGKGVVSEPKMPNAVKLIESLHKVKEQGWQISEQWTVVIPNYTVNELNAHLRDFVWKSDILKNEPGDQANIPYVMDLDFQILANVGDAFSSETTGLVSSFTTTLYEAGAWSDIDYYLIERIDQNLLEEINSRFAVAAVRAEDKKINILINAGTGTNYAGNVTRLTGTAKFYSTNIPAAIKLLMGTGKDIKPGDCLLYLTPAAYAALLAEMSASQVISYAVPSIIQKGIIEELFGVKIVVGGYAAYQQRTNAATGTVDLCWLMRPKRAVAIAPKRDLLVETQKQVATRKLRLTASHTFALKILDFKEIVRIWTSNVRAGA